MSAREDEAAAKALLNRVCVEHEARGKHQNECVDCLAEALRSAKAEGRREALEEAALVVDWYFTTFFSKSPGGKAVDELMEAIRARSREKA